MLSSINEDNIDYVGSNISLIGNNQFYYDESGYRIRKNNKSFYLDDNKVIETKEGNDIVHYLYDENLVIGYLYNNNAYYYERDIFQTIIGIKNSNGDYICKYRYSSYGEPTIDTFNNIDYANIESKNIYLYKGYIYDRETGLYYLNSRYYDPKIGRFITIDNIEYIDEEEINGLNIFIYCGNDPINFYDPTGHLPQWANWVIGGTVIVLLGAGAAFYSAVTNAVSKAIIGGVVGGITNGLSGVLSGTSSGFMWGAVSGALSGALTYGVNIATGKVRVVGSAQRTKLLFHRFASNVQAGKMTLAVGRYSEIHLNASKGLDIRGFRPDVTGVSKSGLSVVEVVSSSQTYISQVEKIDKMKSIYSHISNGVTIDELRFITNWFVF